MCVNSAPPPITTDIDAAASALLRGQLVGIPTETVYGLAARADDDAAVQSIFRVKDRPAASPLIVHVADLAMAHEWVVEIPDNAVELATAYWPGPLTMILPSNGRAAQTTVAGGSTVAIRVPDHPLTLDLIRAVGCGIAAPSANPHTRVSPTTAAHVASYFSRDEVALVLDGGPCSVGLESAIVDFSGTTPRILRSGSISATAIGDVLQAPVPVDTRYLRRDELASMDIASPGQSIVHYAPRARVVVADTIDALHANIDRAGATTTSGIIAAIPAAAARVQFPDAHILLATEDTSEFARQLYAALHAGDVMHVDTIHVLLPTSGAELSAIRDRITRASSAD